MSYRNFTFDKLADLFGIVLQKENLFPEVAEIMPSAHLLESMEDAKEAAITTEKAASEAIIRPIMDEIRKRNRDIIQLFSGESIVADKKNELTGECDFIFAKSPYMPALKTPIITVVEAKIGKIDKAIPQATAQMLGVRIYNQHKGTPIETIYGACTSGTEWLFLRLEHNIIYVDMERYYLGNLPLLLGILQKVVDFYR